MDKNLIKAYNFGNYSRTISNQIELLKLKMKKQLQYSNYGGSFEITPEFLIYVKAYVDQGIYRAVILDKFENPINITAIEDFYDDIMSQRRKVLNEFYEEFEKIRLMRNLTDMIDYD